MDIKITGTKYELSLTGSITEKTTFDDVNLTAATEVVLNVGKVTLINSFGVRNWILWMMSIPEQSSIVLEECPFLFMKQASSVHSFLPARARIQSFYAPFVCPDCMAGRFERLSIDQHYHYSDSVRGRSIELPLVSCVDCKVEMEPDFVEVKVFTFLGNTK